MITLKVKQLPPGLVEAGNLQPATLGALDATALARHPLGATQSSPCIGDCFGIKVRGGDPILLIEGDVPTLTGIGRSMDEGVLIVEGDSGPETGAGMRAGELIVKGNAGDLLGAGMRGGLIRVQGSTGHWVGAALPGAVSGMRGGSILIQRNAGDRIADRMRRGLIVVQGDTGSAAGGQMLAGTLVVLGKPGPSMGSGMRRGSILVRDPSFEPGVGFSNTGAHTLGMIALLRGYLAGLDPRLARALRAFTQAERFVGDRGCGGLGEILRAKA
jgi:formylmethanofuran dehydrogenase subunit C